MHLHAAGGAVHLQYFMPQHQPEATTDLQYSAVHSSSTSQPATMWEYNQAALQSSSSSFSFPSWSPYAAGTTTALLGHGSAFAADSSSPPDMRLPVATEHVHSHTWSQHAEQSSNTGYRENFLDLLSSKNMTPEMFEDVPVGHYAAQAPSGRFGAGSDASSVKYEIDGSPLLTGSTSGMHQGLSMMPRYAYVDNDQMKEGSNHQQQQELAAPAMASFLQQLSTNASVGLHAGSMDYSGMVLDKIFQETRGMEASPFSMRSLPADFSSFCGYKSTTESTTLAQPYMRRADLSHSSKQEQDIVPARSSSAGSGAASDCKKRPSEERTSKVKKSKQECSKASPPKENQMQTQVPKVKIGEKITALQQIVSPFGKTDTASVLFETIKYIKFLHEQVQLLSEPYTNSGSRNKGNVPWGDHAEASKQQGDVIEHDLKDRGLCLVPVSWTPQVYRDGTAMDYWTPAYRGCLYR